MRAYADTENPDQPAHPCSLNSPVRIIYKPITGRYRPVRVADGPITARYRLIKNASWEGLYCPLTDSTENTNGKQRSEWLFAYVQDLNFHMFEGIFSLHILCVMLDPRAICRPCHEDTTVMPQPRSTAFQRH